MELLLYLIMLLCFMSGVALIINIGDGSDKAIDKNKKGLLSSNVTLAMNRCQQEVRSVSGSGRERDTPNK